MSWIYWRRREDDDTIRPIDGTIEPDRVTEQHPLPGTLHFRRVGDNEYTEVDNTFGLPVKVADDGGLWQVRTFLAELAGVSTTAYVANDAVGVGQSLGYMGGPNNAFVLLDAFAIYGAAPTTTADGLNLDFFSKPIPAATDSSAFAPSFASELAFAGEVKINEVVAGLATGLASQATMTTSPVPKIITTGPDGSSYLQGVCGSAFTLASAVLWIKLVYRYANFQGVA